MSSPSHFAIHFWHSTEVHGHENCIFFLDTFSFLFITCWNMRKKKQMWRCEDLVCEIAKHFCPNDQFAFLATLSSTIARSITTHSTYIRSLVRPQAHLCMSMVTCVAARRGHFHCLKYLKENQTEWHWRTTYYAAKSGSIDCLRFVCENGCPLTDDTAWVAAEYGHLDCLQYACENGCPGTRDVCEKAALGGHLDCLRYAHEMGFPWNKGTCVMAAKNGHLECLQYAHEHGCDWDATVLDWARICGSVKCYQYARYMICLEVSKSS